MLRTLLSRQIEDACRLKAKTLLVSSSVGTGQKEALLTSYWGNERYNAERFTTMFAPLKLFGQDRWCPAASAWKPFEGWVVEF